MTHLVWDISVLEDIHPYLGISIVHHWIFMELFAGIYCVIWGAVVEKTYIGLPKIYSGLIVIIWKFFEAWILYYILSLLPWKYLDIVLVLLFLHEDYGIHVQHLMPGDPYDWLGLDQSISGGAYDESDCEWHQVVENGFNKNMCVVWEVPRGLIYDVDPCFSVLGQVEPGDLSQLWRRGDENTSHNVGIGSWVWDRRCRGCIFLYMKNIPRDHLFQRFSV